MIEPSNEANGVRLLSSDAPLLFGAAWDKTVPAGLTILEILEAVGADPVLLTHGRIVLVDSGGKAASVVVPRENWGRVRPRPGIVVTAGIVPRGGGGGGGKKSPVRMVLSLAVMVASFYVGGWVTAALGPQSAFAFSIGEKSFNLLGMVAGGVTSMVGNAIVNAVVPPAGPRISQIAARSPVRDAPVYTITGASNRPRPWQPVREVYGRRRVFPDLAAETYTEVINNKVFLRMLLQVGMGPLKISDIKIGETPIEDFKSVEIDIREGWDTDGPISLYSNDVHQETLGIHLTADGGWHQRRSTPDADELIVDVSFPRGLTELTGQNSRSARTVEVEVEYSPAGQDTWSPAPWANSADEGFDVAGKITITDNVAGGEVRRSGRIKLTTPGQYDVRFRRTTAESASNSILDDTYWSVMRTVIYRDPVTLKEVAKIGLLIEATDQTQNVVDTVNCIAESYYEVYDQQTDTWSWQLSRSPGGAFVKAFTRCKRPLPKDRLNLANLSAWETDCAAANSNGNPKFLFDAVYESSNLLREILGDICAAGRARLGMPDGKWGVVRDVPQTVAAQAITPTNSWGFREVENYVPQPHGLLVQYEDEEAGYRVTTLPVYADGYDENTATEFEVMETVGIVRHEQAWSEGRYHQAVAKLRPSTYEVRMSVEYMDFSGGELVDVAHPVISVGLGSSRIKSLILDGNNKVTGVKLEETVPMEAGKVYGVRIRQAVGGQRLTNTVNVQTLAGETDTLTFWDTALNQVKTWPLSPDPLPGDLVVFGEAGLETAPMIVKSIMPEADLGALVKLVDEAPAVQTADAGTIPDRPLYMTKPPVIDRRPDKPVLAFVVSDETVMAVQPGGGLAPRLIVTLEPRPNDGAAIAEIRVRFKRADALAWTNLAPLPGEAPTVVFSDVEQGVAYDVELNYVSVGGLVSDPALISGHVVVGKASLPADVPSVFLENGAMNWPYDSPPVDFAGFRVYHRAGTVKTVFGAGLAHEDPLISGPPFDVSHLPGGVRTVMVVAVDTDGNESANPAAIIMNLGDPDTANIILSRDLAAEGFPGAITNGTVVGGSLKADGNGTLYLPDGDAPYLPDGSAAYLPETYREMTYEVDVIPDTASCPCKLTLDLTVTGENWTVKYRALDDGLYLPDGSASYLPSGTAAYLNGPGAWMPWPGYLDLTVRSKVTLRVRINGGNVQGRISGFTANFDVPDIEESFEDIAIAATGTRLPITKTYRKIVNVSGITLQDDGGNAARVKVVDKDETLGPLIMALTAAGAGTAGVVDVTKVKGY